MPFVCFFDERGLCYSKPFRGICAADIFKILRVYAGHDWRAGQQLCVSWCFCVLHVDYPYAPRPTKSPQRGDMVGLLEVVKV